MGMEAGEDLDSCECVFVEMLHPALRLMSDDTMGSWYKFFNVYKT